MRRDKASKVGTSLSKDFNPLSSCEERLVPEYNSRILCYFNPLSSCEERRYLLCEWGTMNRISIHSPRVRRDHKVIASNLSKEISIHSPRVRRDSCSWQYGYNSTISIHSPRVRRDWTASNDLPWVCNFNPLSSCEERRNPDLHLDVHINFNPLSSCEERLLTQRLILYVYNFNPLSSCEERRR